MAYHPELDLSRQIYLKSEYITKRYEDELERKYLVEKRLKDAKMNLALDEIDSLENTLRKNRAVERYILAKEAEIKAFKQYKDDVDRIIDETIRRLESGG